MGINVIKVNVIKVNVSKINVIKVNVIKLNVIQLYRFYYKKWKGLTEKRRLVEQYYKEKDKAIKDYKFRRGVSSDFYERVAKPVTEKIGEQIKKNKKNKKNRQRR